MLAAPILAGALIDANFWGVGWRRVLLINVPIGAIALPLAIRSLAGGASHPGTKIDFGTIFSTFSHHLPPDALRVTAWCFLVPLAAAFLLVYRLPTHARNEAAH